MASTKKVIHTWLKESAVVFPVLDDLRDLVNLMINAVDDYRKEAWTHREYLHDKNYSEILKELCILYGNAVYRGLKNSRLKDEVFIEIDPLVGVGDFLRCEISYGVDNTYILFMHLSIEFFYLMDKKPLEWRKGIITTLRHELVHAEQNRRKLKEVRQKGKKVKLHKVEDRVAPQYDTDEKLQKYFSNPKEIMAYSMEMIHAALKENTPEEIKEVLKKSSSKDIDNMLEKYEWLGPLAEYYRVFEKHPERDRILNRFRKNAIEYLEKIPQKKKQG